MKVIVIPAFAILALLAWWLRRDTRLLEPMAVPAATALAGATSDRLVVAWRRAGLL